MSDTLTHSGCFPCPSLEQRNLLAIQRNTEAIAALTVSVQELAAKDVSLQSQIDTWTTTLDQKIITGYRQLFEPDMQAEKTARINGDTALGERITAIEAFDATIPTTYATKSELLAVKNEHADDVIRLHTKIVNGDDAVKTLLNEKVATINGTLAEHAEDIGENSTAIVNEKNAREDADLAIRTDVNVTVGQIYATLRGELAAVKSELEGADNIVRAEFKADDTVLDGKISAAVARIEALEPLLTRVGTLETNYTALNNKVNSMFQLTEADWIATQTAIQTNANNISALGERIDIELQTLRNRVTAIENILINK